jgi:sulfatase maturation enzyme AslB (radical SAM superfamily)
MNPREVIAAWLGILSGNAPLLSIEITRECPLSCPGCYAYNDTHLGGNITLRDLSDYRGDALVNGVLALVRKHKPLHVSLVGGEPLVRHKELSHILPALAEMKVHTLVVTSAVIPIPEDWMAIPRLRVAVSVDGLPEHHDIRRKPATYERILKNIAGRKVNVHWTITRPMMQREGYLEDYLAFWSARPEVDRLWVSTFTPQVGEQADEILTPEDKAELVRRMGSWKQHFPKILFPAGLEQAFAQPPRNPDDCMFSKMSVNYSADLKSRVEPCIFGGTPDCSQCGCAVSTGFHWLRTVKVAGPVRAGHLVGGSVAVGSLVNRLRRSVTPDRWQRDAVTPKKPSLVQVEPGMKSKAKAS